ncbi:SH3 domain-containing protein [Maridesulfovibrio bastinii]|uniref:SH3 domain-containing protein n=1 Tax=Maridesulfovibrio bastinii TaxID=47157 RepID=UPI0004078E51|nr:SH3 domain-containing protein [Maridesulfovibrio bastinii]
MKMKLIYLALLCLTFMLAGCPKQPHTLEKPVVTQKTITMTPVMTGFTKSVCNVRSKATSKSSKVTTLANKTKIIVTGKHGNWYQIKRESDDGALGYIYYKLIHLDFQSYVSIAGHNTKKATIFSESSSNSPKIRSLAPSTELYLIGLENNYYKVKGQDFTGYISADLCIANPGTAHGRTIVVDLKEEVPVKKQNKIAHSKSNSKPVKAVSTPGTSGSSSGDAVADAVGGFFGAVFGTTDNNSTQKTADTTKTAQKGGAANAKDGKEKPKDSVEQILDQLDTAKQLAKKTQEIRKEMLSSLSQTRALQSVVGTTIATMDENLKLASRTAKGVECTGMKKIDVQAFVNDISYDPTSTIESASVKIADNGKMLSMLETKIKSEAADFSKLNNQQLKSMNSIIGAFSNNIHASNSLYQFSMDKSGDIILSIDRAINSYKDKAGPLTIEATKQIAILSLISAQIAAQISQLQSNPWLAITLLGELKMVSTQVPELIGLFKDFVADYNYIESNSGIITEQSKKINSVIMTARRKNSQITTQLEKYYKKKLALSKRLKKSFARKSSASFKDASAKAGKESFTEEELS